MSLLYENSLPILSVHTGMTYIVVGSKLTDIQMYVVIASSTNGSQINKLCHQ